MEDEICGDVRLSIADRLRYLWRNFLRNLHPAPRLPTVSFTATPEGDAGTASPTRVLTDEFLRRELPRLLPPGPVDILEIGCGSGRLAERLEALGYVGTYTGIDMQDRFDARSGGRLERRFVCGDAHAFTPDRAYDLVVSISALEHIPDDRVLLARAAGWLKPGGWQVHLVPSGWGLAVYLWHGFRQYTLDRVAQRFASDQLRVYRLGGLFSLAVHLLAITLAEVVLRLPLRGRLRGLYIALRDHALRWDRFLPVCCSTYAVCQQAAGGVSRPPQTVFLFKRGRRERLSAHGPGEFFYGYREIAASRDGVEMVDEDDLGLGSQSLARRIAARLGAAILRVDPNVALAVWRQRARFCPDTLLVASTTTYGFAIALLRRLGLIRCRTALIVMGITRRQEHPVRLASLRWLLARTALLPISRGEEQVLRHRFGTDATIRYIPFGVDLGFWSPGERRPDAEPFVLAIGNDLQRDWSTLVRAWRPHFPKLRIVTRLLLPPLPANVEWVRGDWAAESLSDAEVRQLYRDALFVVLPIVPTLQPSGQSACLQAMACGKAVVLSDIEGLWDRDRLVDGDTVALVPTGDADALASRVARLLDAPEDAARMGAAARRMVENHFALENTARELDRVLGDL